MLDSLNAAQREAVEHSGSPLLILAGAGSGKTRVITVKIAWLIQSQGIDPASILALTFTNRAAREMRERISLFDPRAADVMVRTFHSFGSWLLRRNASLLGLDPHFSIYDDEDCVQLLATIYPQRPKQLLSAYASRIARAKDFGLAPEMATAQGGVFPDFCEVYQAYQAKLRQIGNVDFGDLIARPTELLDTNEAIRNRLRQRLRVILVDEYQDTNLAQFNLLQQLCDNTTALTVVGDDDQSIYRFRGAEVKNILSFSEHFPGTKIIRLEENYRSSQEILSLASAVVAHNEQRLGKTMFTRRPAAIKPNLWLFGEQDSEIAAIIALIRESPMETAILYRTNSQSRVFEAALLRAVIPYRIVGTLRFYEREEVKDVLSLLRLIANSKDEVAFRRMLNKPARGIGDTSRDLVLSLLDHSAGDTIKALEYAIPRLSKKAASAAAAFVALFEAWRILLLKAEHEGHLGVFVAQVMEESGLAKYHRSQDEVGGTQKQENLEELLNAAALYGSGLDGLTEFLEATELDAQSQADDSPDAQVTLITMHNTKGLEFDRVIISGLEEGIFPRADEYGDDLEEQRRLLYVALTRARHRLYITYTQRKRVFGRWAEHTPSRFIGEMPDELITIEADSSYQKQSFSQVSNYGYGRDEWSGYDSGAEFLEEADLFKQGDLVEHADYGPGRVLQSTIKGQTQGVIVEFNDGRRLKLIPAFAPLKRLES